jgi:hypothetical protein
MYDAQRNLTLSMIKLIRLIPRGMSQPLLVRLVQSRIRARDGHRHSRVVQEVPESRITQPLLRFHPSLRAKSDPGRYGHEKRIDTAVFPLL